MSPLFNNLQYIIVRNNVASSAAILALLECGFTPAIIDAESFKSLNSCEIPYIPPLVDIKSRDENSLNGRILEFSDKVYQNSKIDFIGENKMLICSSGSEGVIPHFNTIFERELINSRETYGKDGSIFYNYISSANISGILTNLVNPLIHDSKVVMQPGFDMSIFERKMQEKQSISETFNSKSYLFSCRNIALQNCLFFENLNGVNFKIKGNILEKQTPVKNEYDEKLNVRYKSMHLKRIPLDELKLYIDSIMLPRDIISYLDGYDCTNIDCSSLKHIYLAGGVNSKVMIKKMREKIPSIKGCTF